MTRSGRPPVEDLTSPGLRREGATPPPAADAEKTFSGRDATLASDSLPGVRSEEDLDATRDVPSLAGKTGVLFPEGTRIDQFRIMRRLGKGGMASVYLARDTSLGRLVALKMIHGHIIDKSHLERFLFEARATATFNHPNIVSIYSVGEYRQIPYVALEYLEGETLRKRLERAQPAYKESLRIALAISEALAEAQRHQLLHRDLKPENVLVPKDGRVRVVDFGLAKLLGKRSPVEPSSPQSTAETLDVSAMSDESSEAEISHSESAITGTPGYMAPEQWVGKAGPTTDMWALGLILCELLAGSRPYANSGVWEICRQVRSPDPVELPDLGEVPTELSLMVARCLQKNPERRPSVEEVRGLLERLVHQDDSDAPTEHPFRGLSAFSERHAGLFFGREGDIATLIERLRDEAIVPIIGPSGAGKSSFVQAGVIPRLREQGRWTVIGMRPGRAPFEALAGRLITPEITRTDVVSAIGRADSEPNLLVPAAQTTLGAETRLAATLMASPALLGLKLAEIAHQRKAKVLLVVDALEELYTLVDDPELRTRFMQAICSAADDPQDPVRVLLTIRDDFLGRVVLGKSARDVFSRVFVLRTPGPNALREILIRPASMRGYTYDDGLVDDMLAQVAGETTCLPLIQFAGDLLWQQRDSSTRRLLRSAYDRMGGITGALAHHADGVIEGMSPQELTIARELFLRMVTPDGTRRALSRAELTEGLSDEAGPVLDRLIAARLIGQRRSRSAEGSGDSILELVHESLISRWGQLSKWIESTREEIAVLNEARQAALTWHRRGRKPVDLWQAEALRDAQRVLGRGTGKLPDIVAQFFEAGLARAREAEQRKRRRIGLSIGLAGLVAAGSLGAALLVAKQKARADAQALRAIKQRAEAQRESAESALARGEMLEARAKFRTSLETDDSPRVQALWHALEQDPRQWRLDFRAGTVKVAYSPDSRRLALGLADGTILLLDASSLALEHMLTGHAEQVEQLRFSTDGQSIHSFSPPADRRVWDLATGTSAPDTAPAGPSGGSLPPQLCGDLVGTRSGSAARNKTTQIFSAEHSVEAIISSDQIELRGPALARPRVIRKRADHFGEVAFSPDEKLFAAVDVGTGGVAELSVYRVDTGDVRIFPTVGATAGLAFSDDGALIAMAGTDGRVRVQNLATGELKVLSGHRGLIRSMAFSTDRRLLATDGNDETVRVWDLGAAKESAIYRGFRFRANPTFRPDGRELVTSEVYQGGVQAWRVPPPGAPLLDTGSSAPLDSVGITVSMDLTHDGRSVVTKSQSGQMLSWDLRTGESTQLLLEPSRAFYAVASSPIADVVAHSDELGRVHLMDAVTGQERSTLAGQSRGVFRMVYSPDGRQLAAGEDQTIYVWDLATGQLKHRLPHSGFVTDLAYNPTGALLASTDVGGDLLRIWDVQEGRLQRSLSGKAMGAVAFGPDGATLAYGEDGGVSVSQLARGERRHIVLGDSLRSLAFHPDGVRVGVAQRSHGAARIWNVKTGVSIALRGHQPTAAVDAIRFTADGRKAVTASDDGTVRVWDADTGLPVWWAPAMMSSPPRMFSQRGWEPLTPDAKASPPPARWGALIEHKARLAVESDDRRSSCVFLHEGALELWDLAADERRFSSRAVEPSRIVALRGGKGCATLEDGQAWLYAPTGERRSLRSSVTTLEGNGDGLLLAAGKEVFILDAAQRQIGRVEGRDRISAVAQFGDAIAIGHSDGSIEVASTRGENAHKVFTRQSTTVSPIVRILAGPAGTLIVGSASGLVTVVDGASGNRLFERTLHGPIIHLLLEHRALYAATELGDHTTIDLSVLEQTRCALLRQVWATVPNVWEDGHVVARPPPTEHPCRE